MGLRKGLKNHEASGKKILLIKGINKKLSLSVLAMWQSFRCRKPKLYVLCFVLDDHRFVCD